MAEPALDQAERDRLAAEVLAAVERLLRDGQSGRVEIHVNPAMQRLVVMASDAPPALLRLRPAA